MAANPEHPPVPSSRDRSIAELVHDATDQLTRLVHEEVALAKAELEEKGRQWGTGAVMFGVAAVAGFLAAASVVTCVIAALSLAIDVWAAALVVAAGLAAVAAAFALRGRREAVEAGPPIPEQAIESTKEDAAWLKSQIRSARR